MTDKISLKRLVDLYALSFSFDKKKYLKYIGLMLGVMMALIILPLISGSYYILPNAPFDLMYAYETDIFGFLLFVFGLISASLTMDNLKTKARRIDALMLPALSIEKYIMRVSIFVVGFLVTFAACCLITDVTRVLISKVLYPNVSCISFLTWHEATDSTGSITLFFILQSLYVLGSSIWPRRAAINTTVAMWIISIAFAIISIVITTTLVLDGHYDLRYSVIDQLDSSCNYIGITLAACAINYTLAYFRYKEIEMIQRW